MAAGAHTFDWAIRTARAAAVSTRPSPIAATRPPRTSASGARAAASSSPCHASGSSCCTRRPRSSASHTRRAEGGWPTRRHASSSDAQAPMSAACSSATSVSAAASHFSTQAWVMSGVGCAGGGRGGGHGGGGGTRPRSWGGEGGGIPTKIFPTKIICNKNFFRLGNVLETFLLERSTGGPCACGSGPGDCLLIPGPGGGGALLAFLGLWPVPPPLSPTRSDARGKNENSLKGPENGGRLQAHDRLCGLRPPPPPSSRWSIERGTEQCPGPDFGPNLALDLVLGELRCALDCAFVHSKSSDLHGDGLPICPKNVDTVSDP